MRENVADCGATRFRKSLGLLAFTAATFLPLFPVAAADYPDGLDSNGHLEAVAVPAGESGFAYARLEEGVQIRVRDVTKNIIFYGPETVRVNANLGTNHWTAPSIVVVSRPAKIPFDIAEDGDSLILASERLRLEVSKETGAIRFLDAAGKLYTEERADRPQVLEATTTQGGPTLEATNTFTLRDDEAIYGLGFLGEESSNRRGKNLLLVQTNVGSVIPVIMSSRRYGVMWDTYSQMRFSDGPEGTSLWAEDAPGGVDYYFMAGATADDVIADYRALTGQAPMYPRQAFGLFMSKERYKTQEQILDVARTFREVGFPLDYIVQDWQYWGSDKDGTWSGMTWNEERFPDPDGMIDELHDLHLKVMVSIWPSIGNDTALAHELDEHDLRFEPLHWISGKARVYDAYSPLGRQIYFKHIKSGLLDKGVDALWMDGTEIEVSSAMWDPQDNIRDIKALGRNALGDFSRYLNTYTLLTTEGTYEGARAVSDKRVFTLTRSAWAGAQRTAAASWSGDVFSSWKTLRQQVADGVNVTVTGNPYWTQDTGGFFVTEFPGGEQNAAWRELYARWLQFSAFNPIMRIHGTSVEREPYLFRTMDPPVYNSLLASTKLRYSLLPYIYSLSNAVTADSYTLMRPLVMDFPDDRATDTIDDTFMFGPALLVHPVTRPMYSRVLAPAKTIPAQYLATEDGRAGLAGQYFEGENFERPMGETRDATLDKNWPSPPLAEIPAGLSALSHFSGRWHGVLTAPEDGTYELGIEGDDGYRLKVDGKLLVEDWNAGAARYKSGELELAKGQRVTIDIDYFQGTGDRSLRLAWRLPSERAELARTADAPPDTTHTTYLPKGADWYDFWTGERFAGGTSARREVPLDIVPLYVRAGSIVPFGPDVQYATEKLDAPYDVRIYPGADGRFTLYEDDNETYAYERGASASYDLVWDDASRTLTIGARKGSYPGMVQERDLRFAIMPPSTGGAIVKRAVHYTGKALPVDFNGETE